MNDIAIDIILKNTTFSKEWDVKKGTSTIFFKKTKGFLTYKITFLKDFLSFNLLNVTNVSHANSQQKKKIIKIKIKINKWAFLF